LLGGITGSSNTAYYWAWLSWLSISNNDLDIDIKNLSQLYHTDRFLDSRWKKKGMVNCDIYKLYKKILGSQIVELAC